MSIPQYTLADMDIARRLWMASDADGTIQSDELARARFYHDRPRKLTASQISTVFEDLTGKPWDSERMLDLVERRAAGLCDECGDPALIRVILRPDGSEVRRVKMSRCERHARTPST